jgi:hypothetical protein
MLSGALIAASATGNGPAIAGKLTEEEEKPG